MRDFVNFKFCLGEITIGAFFVFHRRIVVLRGFLEKIKGIFMFFSGDFNPSIINQ